MPKKKTTPASAVGKPNVIAKRNGWTIINATSDLDFKITEQHVKNAKCKDPGKCVVAQALRDLFGIVNAIEEIAVGSNITKLIVHSQKRCYRYATPGALAAALKHFDVTKQWDLPPATYTLRALPKSSCTRRWESAKRNGGKQSTFRGRIQAPTRYAININQLTKLAA